MSKTKKIVFICLLSLFAIVAGCFAYAFISYAVTYSPMNSFMTLENSIILSCVFTTATLLATLLILLVSGKKPEKQKLFARKNQNKIA